MIGLASILWQDIRYASRRLTRAPGFTAVATLTLGVGMGANVAICALVYQVLIKPFPYNAPEEVVIFSSELSHPEFRDWQTQATALDDIAAFLQTSSARVGRGEQLLEARWVSWNFFQVLGVQASTGRLFVESDGDPGANRVVVVSHDFWKNQLGGPVNLESVYLGGRATDAQPASSTFEGSVFEALSAAFEGSGLDGYRVAGVAPAGFEFGGRKTDVWIPLVLSDTGQADRGNDVLRVIGRLASGVSIPQAQAQVDTISAQAAGADASGGARRRVQLLTLREEFAGSVRPTYFVLFAGAIGVLLVACFNVANLLLLRGARRQQELAIRSSLGAGRGRLVIQLLAESACLSFVGALVAWPIGHWTLGILDAFVPAGMAGLAVFHRDGVVLSLTVSVALMTACVAGFGPAFRLSRSELAAVMQEGGRSGFGRQGRRLRSFLVTAEIGVATVLLVCSSLLVTTMNRLQAVDAGFDTENLLTVSLPIRRDDYYDELLRRVRTLPGVLSAGVGTTYPLIDYEYGGRRALTIDGLAETDATAAPRALLRTISPGYLETLKTPVLQGRAFERGDLRQSRPVGLINQTMARRYWPGRNPVGERVKIGGAADDGPSYTVIGVVGDVKQRALEFETEPELMLPYAQYSGAFYRPRTLLLRNNGDVASLAAAVRREIAAIDPGAPPPNIRTMSDIAATGLEERRLRTILVTAFAALSLSLSLLGIYAVVSFAVSDRTREIGIRLALGARRASVKAAIIREGLILSAIGCLAGLGAAAAMTWTLQSFLYEVAPTDPGIFATVALLTLFVATAASGAAARRITKIDPAIALHHE